MTAALAGLVAAAAATGVLLLVAAIRPVPPKAPAPARAPAWVRAVGDYFRGNTRAARRRQLSTVAAVGGGMLIWWLTGWVLAVLVTPAAVLGLPYLLRAPAEKNTIARLEAMEEWTRNLAGVLDVGVGLEQAIITSARSAPEPIAGEVRTLAARLRAGVRTTEALRSFADELDDATGDDIAAALVLAAEQRGTGLVTVLEGLSEIVADNVKNRRELEVERARPRTSARWVTVIAVLAVGALSLTGDYLQPYRTGLGQLILFALLIAYVLALLWMRRASTTAPLPRFLASRDDGPAPGAVV